MEPRPVAGSDRAPPWLGADTPRRVVSEWRAYGWAILCIAISTAVGQWVSGHTTYRANLAMISLFAVLIVSLRGHRRASLLAAVLGVLTFIFFWTLPVYTFWIETWQDAATEAVMGVVGVAIALLTTRLVEIITRHVELERQLIRFNRTLRTLGLSNRALRQAEDVPSLVQSVCEIAVTAGGYRLAWIGLAEHDAAKSVRPIAAAGYVEGYVDQANITWDDTERGRGPTGTAIRTGHPYIARNLRIDPRYGPWREEALKRGYASSVALPIVTEGEVLGAFMVYAAETDAFDPQEVELLEELAGDVGFGICLLRDRAEKAQHEEELRRRTAELEAERELNALKTAFINSVSHDLRSPITSILGYSEFLEDEIAGPLTPQQRKFAQEILKGSKRLEGMVSDLLDGARLDAGTFRLYVEPLDLAQAVQEAVASLKPQVEEAHLTLDVSLSDGPLWVMADPQRIDRVFANLLGNAIKFTPAGGRIGVRVFAEGECVRCEVTDTGIGIAAEDVPKLFHRFSQLEAGKKKGGTGLGLSISKAFVEAHGGTIGVESTPDQGSTFWFTLPRIASPSQANGEEPATGSVDVPPA